MLRGIPGVCHRPVSSRNPRPLEILGWASRAVFDRFNLVLPLLVLPLFETLDRGQCQEGKRDTP